MAYVTFLSDDDFRAIVLEILSVGVAAKRKAETKFSRNVIDPFSVLLEMGAFNVGYETWYTSEMARQSQKTLSNKIGAFHQRLLGAVSGWEDLKVGKGVDLVNNSRKIIAEVKNKHNTLKGASQAPLYKELHNAVMLNDSKYKGYTAYYVGVVPKKPNRFSTPFTPSDKETSSRCPENPLIRQIDGASFYALVTGIDDALEQVYKALPQVINDCGAKVDHGDAVRVAEFFKAAYVPKPPKPSSRTRRPASK